MLGTVCVCLSVCLSVCNGMTGMLCFALPCYYYYRTRNIDIAVSEIFSVKEWPDIEIWVWGRSRSLEWRGSIDHV